MHEAAAGIDKDDLFGVLLSRNLSLLGIRYSQGRDVKNFEHIIYELFRLYDVESCEAKLGQPPYPRSDRHISNLDIRKAAFEWLLELKRDGMLGNVPLRQSTFGDLKSRKCVEALLAFSTVVLQHAMEVQRLSS